MGSPICKCNSNQISNLLDFFSKLSDAQLADNAVNQLKQQRIKPIPFEIQKKCQKIFNFLRKSHHENLFLNSERERIENKKNNLKNLIKQGTDLVIPEFYSFCRDFRLLNFQKFPFMIQQRDQDDYIQELLQLYQGVSIYCEYTNKLLQRSKQLWGDHLLARFWAQFQQNIDHLETIYNFDLINECFSKFGQLKYPLSLRQFMLKIWGNHISNSIENSSSLLSSLVNKNYDTIQCLDCFLIIQRNEYQVQFAGAPQIKYSDRFNKFLNSFKEQLFQYLTPLNEDLSKIISEHNINRLKLLLPEQLHYFIIPWICEYVEQQIKQEIKGKFRDTRKYLVELVQINPNPNSTIKKLIDEEEEDQQFTKNEITFADCKTTYGSIFPGQKIEIQHQRDTEIFCVQKNEWQLFNQIDKQFCDQLIKLSQELDQLRVINRIVISENQQENEQAILYFNTILDYTHINVNQDVQNILLPMWLNN